MAQALLVIAGSTVIYGMLVAVLLYLGRRSTTRLAARTEYIRSYVFPPSLYENLRQKRPHLSCEDCGLVGQALRDFFMAYLKCGQQFVCMPTKVTDELWHEFILHTQAYQTFCQRAFGSFLHHNPPAVLGERQLFDQGLRTVLRQAWSGQGLTMARPLRLPLLFGIDAQLDIPDGFHYVLDCGRAHSIDGNETYCVTEIAKSETVPA